MACISMNRWLFAWVCLLAACAAPAMAQEQPWKVDGKLRGKPDGPSDFKKSEDVSGIACAPGALPRLCVLADDETQGAQIVLLKKDELVAGDYIRLTDAQHKGKPLELDAEGVAYEDGNFYVIGSHGRARHETNSDDEAKNNAKAAATRQIFRIALPASAVDMKNGKLVAQPVITPSPSLASILQGSAIGPFYDKALADNGLTIEGIAVHDKRVYLGMRGPVMGANAAVLSVAASALFDRAPSDAKVDQLALENDTLGKPRGVRDLVRYGGGFLVLAGPVNDPPNDVIAAGDYSIYLWDGTARPRKLVDLKSYGNKVKPEALLPLDGDAAGVRLLLLFDGPKEGAPRPLEVKF